MEEKVTLALLHSTSNGVELWKKGMPLCQRSDPDLKDQRFHERSALRKPFFRVFPFFYGRPCWGIIHWMASSTIWCWSMSSGPSQGHGKPKQMVWTFFFFCCFFTSCRRWNKTSQVCLKDKRNTFLYIWYWTENSKVKKLFLLLLTCVTVCILFTNYSTSVRVCYLKNTRESTYS